MSNLTQNLTKKVAISLAVTLLASTAQAGNYQSIFDKFTSPKGWTWSNVQSIPKAASDSNSLTKDQNFKGRYSLERTLSDGIVTGYGSQAAPNTLVFYSGGWGTTDTGNLIKLSDVVNPSNLTIVKSNCNFGKITDGYQGKDTSGHRFNGANYIDYQNVYKWTQAGSKPLYVVEQRGGGWVNTGVSNQGVNSSIIITPSLAQLKTAMVQHGWHKNSAGKLISCSFS